MKKIISVAQVKTLHIPKNRKIVFASGVFDLFHYAHFKALKKSSLLGDIFIVQIDGNTLVTKRKGKDRPYIDERHRAEIVSSLDFVDYVFISNNPSEDLETLQIVRPAIFIRAVKPGETRLTRQLREKKILPKMPGGKIVWLKQSPEISTTRITSVLDHTKIEGYRNHKQRFLITI